MREFKGYFWFYLISAYVALASGQTLPGENYERFTCENGTYGSMALTETTGVISATASFVKVSDCDSLVRVEAIPTNSCVLRPPSAPVPEVRQIQTPSTIAPTIQYLDVGEAITVRGPGREIVMKRQLSGPFTTYTFQEVRTPTIAELLNPTPNLGILAPGRLSISYPGGRDLGEFNGGLDFTPFRLTTPAQGATQSGSNPPSIEWSGLPSNIEKMPLFATISSMDSRQAWTMNCNVGTSGRSQFQIPTTTWNEIPATVRESGSAAFALVPQIFVNLNAPGLDSGLLVSFPQIASTILMRRP